MNRFTILLRSATDGTAGIMNDEPGQENRLLAAGLRDRARRPSRPKPIKRVPRVGAGLNGSEAAEVLGGL